MASQRSFKSTQESSQSSSKSFKQPPRPSPKRVPKFKASSMIYKTLDPLLPSRSSAPAKRSQVHTEDNALRSFDLQNAVTIARDKLGVSEKQTKLPPSPARDMSAPSTSLDTATTVSSPLSSLDSSILCHSPEDVPVITSEDIPVYTAENRPAVCPMCKQPVDRSYLEAFSTVGMRMSLRKQAQFCTAHKERSAESEWEKRGYPEIDWQQLDTRITNFHSFMDEILSRRRFSFYRNSFEDYLKSRKNKTLQESLMGGDEIEGTSPGYYGGRGAKVMYGCSFFQTHTSGHMNTALTGPASSRTSLTFSGRTTSCPDLPGSFAGWQLQTSSSRLVECPDTCKRSWSRSSQYFSSRTT